MFFFYKVNIFVDIQEDNTTSLREEKSVDNVSKTVNKTDNTPIYSSVKKNKVSTAVGRSPPREARSVADGSVQTYDVLPVKSELNKSDFHTKSTGTSPPPQNISTQVRN